MRFWNISRFFFFFLSFWMPGRADLVLENCKEWKQEGSGFPTYDCSIPENSTIRLPLKPNNWTYVSFRRNSTSKEVTFLGINHGASQLFSSEFRGCSFSDGYLILSNLQEGQQGEYEVKEKETIKARIYVCIQSDRQSKRNQAVSVTPMLPTSFLLLYCVLRLLW